MSEEQVQPLEPRAPEPPSADTLPNLIVQLGDDRWKRTTKKQTPPPRFGIRHILLWTACWGLYIALIRRYLSNDPGISSLLSVALFGIGYSAALLGLAICLARQIRGETWPIEPGEWLLVMTGTIFVFGEVQTNMFPNTFTRPFLVLTAIRCVLLLIPILGQSMSSRWKCLFLLLLTIHAAVLANVLLGNWFQFTPHMRQLGTRIIMLSNGAVIDWTLPVFWSAMDYQNHKRYTWLHWLGIATGIWLAGCCALTLFG